MHYFDLRDGEMYCEDVPLAKIAQEVGTPVYVYSKKTLERHFRAFDESFASSEHLICYSVKANSNLSILKLFAKMGSGFDIVSGGELYRVLKAGGDPAKVVYSGVGKKREEIEAAIEAGILMFSIESFQELEYINRVAKEIGKRAPVSLRVNPDVDPKTHPYITTGMKKNKFGIDIGMAFEGYRIARSFSNIDPIGVNCHIGSQLTEVTPFVDSLSKLKVLVEKLHKEKFDITYLDLGGGLGITYLDEKPPHPSQYAEAIKREAAELNIKFVFEPGRVIVGNAGILLAQVLYTKDASEKHFVIVDGGMNDLIRPSLYGAYHEIRAVRPNAAKPRTADMVGPICESGDFFAKDRLMPDFAPGDLAAIMSAGAYGFSMSSNYNSRPRPPEVLVDASNYSVIRRRETNHNMVALELPPEEI